MKAFAGVCTAVALFGVALAGSALSGRASAAAETAPPAVVVTLKPLHSLVAGVMKGIGAPILLFPDGAKTGPLDAAQAAAVAKARVLFWLDPRQAPTVAPLVAKRPDGIAVVALMRAPGVRLMDARAGHRRVVTSTARPPARPVARKAAPAIKDGNVIFRKRGDPAARPVPRAVPRRAPARNWTSKAVPPGKIATPDPRIWLDPRNAIAIVRAAANALATADPANAMRYRRNAAVLVVRIEAQNDGITATARALRKAHYAVTNNGLQYFEDNYLLTPALEFRLTSPQPAATALAAARKRIAAARITCVLAPTPLAADAAHALVAGTKARLVALDVMGRAVPAGPDAYFAIIRSIRGKMAACLG